ncbi:MAG: CDP-glucose 4,6-dehydratase [Rickettsiales bacterium TMED289]|nr:MAG: CDP-glucose 4,6-dehydratase [Rickettsiales bacterium TMED289]
MSNFWKDKKVLITGHSGFKGSWLTLWLNSLGAEVYGISLEPDKKEKNLFHEGDVGKSCKSIFSDITNFDSLKQEIKKINPDIVFHLAAQALVRESYRDPLATFRTNIIGTANLLQSLVGITSTKVSIMITTDKVYKNNEWFWPYREDDTLGGIDPYSSSKAASEILISSYRNSILKNQDINIASARAGNVIGGGDWSKDRLIPDAMRAWETGEDVIIRNPNATRPWQHVLDPLNGYITLAEKLWDDKNLSGAYNFGPDSTGTKTVIDILELAQSFYNKGSISIEPSKENFHEAGMLALDPSKGEKLLGVKCNLEIKEALRRTIDWYKCHQSGDAAYDLCMHDINSYISA